MIESKKIQHPEPIYNSFIHMYKQCAEAGTRHERKEVKIQSVQAKPSVDANQVFKLSPLQGLLAPQDVVQTYPLRSWAGI